ncbi:MAG: HAD family phosphatase [Candidatus Sumerlaeaceae bacterium]|nr:HAD family phosphatase [Candidatus Sumerlaeaceae bacterium]
MIPDRIPGLGTIPPDCHDDFESIEIGGGGRFRVGLDGVVAILVPRDKKTELIVFPDKTLVYVRSALGYPAIYPLEEAKFEPPAKAVLMDLDGTSVRSEEMWMWLIERTVATLLNEPDFHFVPEDFPHVAGHSISEHLAYCIEKYCPFATLEQAREIYYELVAREMKEIEEGRGHAEAFHPAPYLKEFLLELKAHGVKIGLVTSGLFEKAWPEILAAFRTMGMGNPLEFYDSIISAGTALRKGQVGTLGELEPKPHPWLYAETAAVGLGIGSEDRCRVAGIEDSSAGVVAVRLAGFYSIGVAGGNYVAGGVRAFVNAECQTLADALPILLGR